MNTLSRNPYLILHAHAKVNFFLHIGKKTSSGYHQLQTLFQEISLDDVLLFHRTHDGLIRFYSSDPALPSGEKNLVVQALQSLQKNLGTRHGMLVYLRKKIPQGAGLGGGSSDAAAALKAGWALWAGRTIKNKQIPPQLDRVAFKLGADVPFFLRGGRCWASGIGERLTPLPSGKKQWLAVVYPRVSVSTAKAYRWLDREHFSLRDESRNSFESVVFKKFPKIAKAARAMTNLGCETVTLSGSGSALFGFVGNPSKGRRIVGKLKKHRWDSFLVHTIPDVTPIC